METFKVPAFEYYKDEGTYISPNEVNDVAIDRLKSRKIGAKILNLK